MLTVGSLFSGIGGLELGLERTGGFKTAWQIEMDPYASAVLAHRWPTVPRHSDVRDCGAHNLERVDVLCGGFPCQDVSVAGKRAGLNGKRSTLWSEYARIIREIKPRWVVAENVPGLLSSDGGKFFAAILGDLASCGYDAEWGVLSAAGVGAPHLRKRLFIVAKLVVANRSGLQNGRGETPAESHSDGSQNGLFESAGKDVSDAPGVRSQGGNGESGAASETLADTNLDREQQSAERGNEAWDGFGYRCKTVAHAKGVGVGPRLCAEKSEGERWGRLGDEDWWSVEPNVGRVAHGVPSRVDRIKCLGNAVVPQVAQKVGKMILAAA